MGTVNAYTQSKQAVLVQEILNTGIPAVVVALRLPYDLRAFPKAQTYICTYSILEPSMKARLHHVRHTRVSRTFAGLNPRPVSNRLWPNFMRNNVFIF